MAPKKLLVTGANGAMGGYAVERLLERGHAVRALAHREDERSKRLQDLGAEVVIGDLLKLNDVRLALRRPRRKCHPGPCGTDSPHGARARSRWSVPESIKARSGRRACCSLCQRLRNNGEQPRRFRRSYPRRGLRSEILAPYNRGRGVHEPGRGGPRRATGQAELWTMSRRQRPDSSGRGN